MMEVSVILKSKTIAVADIFDQTADDLRTLRLTSESGRRRAKFL